MGQQQLLLIILGVIIVGIAVVVGINVFSANAENSTKDAIVSDCTTIGNMAQQYYRKPTTMGGGGNTFTGFAIPAKLTATPNGSYTATVAAQSVTLKGSPLANSGYTWYVETVVTPDSIKSVFK